MPLPTISYNALPLDLTNAHIKRQYHANINAFSERFRGIQVADRSGSLFQADIPAIGELSTFP